jgi:hypothetical protein
MAMRQQTHAKAAFAMVNNGDPAAGVAFTSTRLQ